MHLPRHSGILATLLALGSAASAQTCTNLCLEQLPANSCPNGGTTSISGKVYTPNGTDPLPNVLVYIPNAPVDPFTPGVSCAVAGQPPSGSPLVGTTTAVDGSFTLTNVPVGSNIPLVIQSGRWRRQLTVATTSACANTAFNASMPKNQKEGDIPLIAITTGDYDQVECVLRKVGVQDTEFTNPGGGGRINLYLGDGNPGAQIDTSTPSESTLMGTTTNLNQYDVLMLPCQGGVFSKTADEESNFATFANAGGRVYSSHYSYVYLDGNPNLPPVANWSPGHQQYAEGTGIVDTTFAEGETLAQWLQLTGASTIEGQIPIYTLRHDLDSVIPPTQSWLTLQDAADGNPIMQFVFDTPVAAKNQCGRVLFNEYHVEDPGKAMPKGVTFPNECSNAPMTPQEKLLEFSLFELTNDGGEPTISPTSADFGSEPVGNQTAAKTFIWTNNSTFPASATAATASAEFPLISNNCSQVAGGGSCQIKVAFKPSALGARTGTLTVNSSGPSLTAALTGTGTPDLSLSAMSLAFGNDDVGDPIAQTLVVTNSTTGPVAYTKPVTTGDYATTTTCPSSIAAMSSCDISVIFTPTTTGPRPGTMTLGVDAPVTLTGNGVDFTFSIAPTSGKVIAGLGVQTIGTSTPIAGFDALVTLTCSTTAPAVTCTPASSAFTLSAATTNDLTIDTVSKYTVVGYGGFGGPGSWLWMIGGGSGLLILATRRRIGRSARVMLCSVLLGVMAMSVTGCSGKLPAKNASYTPAGTYTVTLLATDGFLKHSATYSLVVTAK